MKLDLLLPRILADIPIPRQDLAAMAKGSFYLGGKTCSHPHYPFGK
jgi:formylmethanofuran dehydrogenase subunit E